MDTQTPPTIPDGAMPSELVPVGPPVKDGISWRFRYRLRGDPVQPGHPLYDEDDAVQVRVIHLRPKDPVSYKIMLPGDILSPVAITNRYSDLKGLVENVLTWSNLGSYAKWLAGRYGARLEAQMRRDSGL